MPVSWVERLAQLVYVLVWLAILAGLFATGERLVTGRWPGGARVDPRTGTALFRVETDRGTGCEWVITPWGGIMPRTGRDGKQLCPTTAPP